MYICDGSLVLMESISRNFCGMSLRELLSMYFDIVTGQEQKEAYHIPILHQSLSHIMGNAKCLQTLPPVFSESVVPRGGRLGHHTAIFNVIGYLGNFIFFLWL